MRPEGPGRYRRAVPGVVVASVLLLILQVAGGALGWWPLGLDVESLTLLGIMVLFLALGPLLTSWLPAESDLAVAASTLAVAALFNPLRRRVQGGVDRRFNRARYDAEQVVDEFVGSLHASTDAGAVISGWADVVAETMQAASVAVWGRDAR